MRTFCVKNGLVMVVILLFIGVAFQPVIIADVSIEYDDSELVEITIEIFEVNRVQKYTVILTQKQAEELENLINNFEIELDSADSIDETEAIFKDTVVSLNKLGLLLGGMSVEEAQRLVTGEEQNPRIVKLFERYYSKNQKSLDIDRNFLCLIAGDTSNTVFIGPFALLFGLHGPLLFVRNFAFFEWLKNNNPDFWSWWSVNFGNFHSILLFFRMFFWIAFGAGLNFLPLKIGAYMFYGWYTPSFDPWEESEWIPAKGWIITNGLSGKKQWTGSFFGDVLGFTGIKIYRDLFDFFYLGSALLVRIEEE